LAILHTNIMSGKVFQHPWNGEHAQKFARSVENMKKSRYIPFAKEIYNFVNYLVKKENPIIMDVGCGPGFLLFEIAKLIPDSELIGIDFSEDMLRIAREKEAGNELNSITFKHGPAENIPSPDNYSDVVVCLNSFHDFDSTKKTLSEIYRITKKNGIFILKDKNGAYPKWRVILRFIPLIFKSGLKRTVTYYKSRELWLDPERVIKMMKDLGFKIEYLNKKLDYLLVGRK
jgi:ubiquinone/menaquinone biosynthesis C-methylase UbiE